MYHIWLLKILCCVIANGFKGYKILDQKCHSLGSWSHLVKMLCKFIKIFFFLVHKLQNNVKSYFVQSTFKFIFARLNFLNDKKWMPFPK